jgi:hypothetical protein
MAVFATAASAALAIVSASAVPFAASAPEVRPVAPALEAFATPVASPRDAAMYAGSAATFFVSAAFFASAALVAAAPRAGAVFFKTFCLALQRIMIIP